MDALPSGPVVRATGSPPSGVTVTRASATGVLPGPVSTRTDNRAPSKEGAAPGGASTASIGGGGAAPPSGFRPIPPGPPQADPAPPPRSRPPHPPRGRRRRVPARAVGGRPARFRTTLPAAWKEEEGPGREDQDHGRAGQFRVDAHDQYPRGCPGAGARGPGAGRFLAADDGKEEERPGPAVPPVVTVEPVPEHRESPLEAGPDRLEGGGEAGRDVGRGEILEVAQEDGGPVRLLQLAHGVGHALDDLGPLEEVRRGGRERARRGRGFVDPPAAFPAPEVGGDVPEHGPEPGPRGARRGGLEGAEPDLLLEVVGAVPVADQRHGDPPHPGAVGEQFLEPVGGQRVVHRSPHETPAGGNGVQGIGGDAEGRERPAVRSLPSSPGCDIGRIPGTPWTGPRSRLR